MRLTLLGAVSFGVQASGLSSIGLGQQTPSWSPQPFSPPSSPQAVPVNNLRNSQPLSSSAQSAPQVVRWRKVENAPAPQNSSYSQSLAKSSQDTTSTLEPKSTAPTHHSNELTLQPASGWRTPNTKSTTSSAPNLAATLPPRLAPTPVEDGNAEQFSAPKRTKLSPNQASSRRNAPVDSSIRLASFQGESGNGSVLPGGSLPGLPQSNLPSDSSRSLLPPANNVPAPTQSLLDLGNSQLPSTPRSDVEPERIHIPQSNSSETTSPSDAPSLNNDFRDEEDSIRPMRRSLATRGGVNCDSLRQALEDSDITKIRVDSSPSFVEGYKSERAANTKDSFVQNANQRKWYNVEGQLVGEGKLVDIAYGSVILETSHGKRSSYLLNKLSEADQVYVAEAWGVPITCALGDGSFPQRTFIPTTVTWKASGACHKPLYFEEPQLERYGHEWGPVVQPAISSLNFFKNVAVLPYKMGIHPMNECQYSLGYYRPGSCAPWTVGPIPISLRGAATQAAAVTGIAGALP